MQKVKKTVLILAIVAAVAVVGYKIILPLIFMGPRNTWGMLRYDQRREGDLEVGHAAPDVALLGLDGKTPVHLRERLGGKPAVLVFGSFT